MTAGMGFDLCAIVRMERSLQSESFRARVFGPEEWAALSRLGEKRRAESAAANFAAKEAFLKAAGVGLGGFALADIQCLRKESGAPYLLLSGTAAEHLAANHLRALVSLTHESGLAGAVVLLETAN